MLKKGAYAVAAVFVLVGALDFVIHGIILQSAYEATAALWRPMGEMKMGLMYAANLVSVVCLVALYGFLIGRKNVKTGVIYGLLLGTAQGIGFGFGSYSVMPIPLSMALAWFLGTVVELGLGGALMGAILRSDPQA